MVVPVSASCLSAETRSTVGGVVGVVQAVGIVGGVRRVGVVGIAGVTVVVVVSTSYELPGTRGFSTSIAVTVAAHVAAGAGGGAGGGGGGAAAAAVAVLLSAFAWDPLAEVLNTNKSNDVHAVVSCCFGEPTQDRKWTERFCSSSGHSLFASQPCSTIRARVHIRTRSDGMKVSKH